MDQLRQKKGFICDMDGVIYHGNRLLPGVKEFVDWLYREEKNFLFLTNSSERRFCRCRIHPPGPRSRRRPPSGRCPAPPRGPPRETARADPGSPA